VHLAALAFWVAVLVGAVVVVGMVAVAVAVRENSGAEYMWNVDVME
jgi:hypothetical protein